MRVYTYSGSPNHRSDPIPGVTPITTRMQRDDPLFNPHNSLNASAVIIVSYNLVPSRNSPAAQFEWLMQFSKEELIALSVPASNAEQVYFTPFVE